MSLAAPASSAAGGPEAPASPAPYSPCAVAIVALGRVAGVAVALLGLTVLVGWYTHDTALLRVQPAFVAMAYNTALGFLLSGLGLLAALARGGHTTRASRACGLAVALLGLLTLGEYLGGRSLGLDELLMRAYIRSGVTAPGRMAFSAALCFSLVGGSLLVGGARFFPLSASLRALSGALVMGLGTVALSGYMTGIMQSYAWGHLTRMAVHTGAGFVVLGTGVVALAWSGDRGGATPRWLPLFAFIGGAAATLCVWQALVVEESAHLDLIRRLEAGEAVAHLGALSRAQTLMPLGALLGGLALSALLAGAAWLAQTARTQSRALRLAQAGLEERVRERTEDLARANGALQEVAGWQRGFLRDVLAGVTEGKLRLCDGPGDLPPARGVACGGPIRLARHSGLSGLRCRVLEAAAEAGFADERVHDLVTAVNEAGMNAIVHAEAGTAWVFLDSTGVVQVRVEDAGQGISVENLPQATLSRGFTTAGTLGHGLKMMLQTTDRLWLLTGPSGTTVVLEQERTAPAPAWSRAEL